MESPYEIIHLIEEERIFGAISLTTLLEIRFLLRRKKNYTLKQIEGDIGVFTSLLDVIIPDEINLIKANSLQADLPLDPFDAIHLAISIGLSPVTLLTRDKDFIKIARRFLTAMTPEDFLVTLKRS